MPDETHANEPNIFPALGYRDAKAATEFLATAFGFERRVEYPNPDGTIAHAELSFGPGWVMLGSRSDTPDPANPWSTVSHGLYVAVDDVDAHYARAKAAGAEIVRDLSETDYGSKEYSARDLEGHLWSFGTYRPGGEAEGSGAQEA